MALPAVSLAVAALFLKPVVFEKRLQWQKERKVDAWEVGVRPGQASECGLPIAFMATAAGAIGDRASYVIQLATLITFTASSYYIVMRLPTPIAASDSLRRD